MKSDCRIIVSIISWNYLDKMDSSITALLSQLNKESQIVITETGKKGYYKSFSDDRLKLTREAANDGFAVVHGRVVEQVVNQGFDGILLLNPDIVISENFVSRLNLAIENEKNETILGGPIYNLINGNIVLEYGGFPCSPDIPVQLTSYKELHSLTELHYDVEDLHGAFVYIPSVILKNHSWMDPSYFLYGEENEYFRRLRESGVKIKVYASLALLHENGGTFNLNYALYGIREYYRTRNRLYNNRRFLGWKSYLEINYLFLFKYFVGRYIFKMKSFMSNDINYYNYLGHMHFIKGIRGKVFDPNDYV